MRHLLIKLLSPLVSKKNGKRQHFLEHFDPIERNKALIKQARKDLLWLKGAFRTLNISKNYSYILSYKYAFDSGDVNSYSEHMKNVQNLKNNLSREACANLENIINLIEVSAKYPIKLPELWLREVYGVIPDGYYKELEFYKKIEGY